MRGHGRGLSRSRLGQKRRPVRCGPSPGSRTRNRSAHNDGRVRFDVLILRQVPVETGEGRQTSGHRRAHPAGFLHPAAVQFEMGPAGGEQNQPAAMAPAATRRRSVGVTAPSASAVAGEEPGHSHRLLCSGDGSTLTTETQVVRRHDLLPSVPTRPYLDRGTKDHAPRSRPAKVVIARANSGRDRALAKCRGSQSPDAVAKRRKRSPLGLSRAFDRFILRHPRGLTSLPKAARLSRCSLARPDLAWGANGDPDWTRASATSTQIEHHAHGFCYGHGRLCRHRRHFRGHEGRPLATASGDCSRSPRLRPDLSLATDSDPEITEPSNGDFRS